MLQILILLVGMAVIFIINSLVMKKNQLTLHARRIDAMLRIRFETVQQLLAESPPLSAEAENALAAIKAVIADPTPTNDRRVSQLLASTPELRNIAAATEENKAELVRECKTYDREVAVFNRAIARPPGRWFSGMLKLHPFKPAFSPASDRLR